MKLLDKATADMAEPPFIDDFFEGFATLGETLWSIATVLRILGDTPNAYINQEALEELQLTVEFAASLESQEWAKELLKSDSWLPS